MFVKRYAFLAVLIGIVSLPLLTIAAEQQAGWRGDGTGVYPDAKPVMVWSQEKNVIWKTPMEKFSNSLPIMLNGKLYVGSEIDKLVCLDAATGKILWEKSNSEDEILTPAQKAERVKITKQLQPVKAQKRVIDREYNKARRAYRKNRKDKELGKKVRELKKQRRELEKKLAPLFQFMPKIHKVTGYSTPTPVTDGKNIYTCYGTGLAAAYTPDGKRLWLKVIEKPTNQFGYSSSPVFAGGKFIVAYKHIIALDPQTGKEIWKVPSKYRWGTPLVTTIGGKEIIITPNGEIIRATDGVLLSKSLPSLQYNSAMIHKGIVYTYNKDKARAHRLPAKAEAGAKTELLWEVPITSDRYYGSPVTDGKTVYCITRAGKLTALDLKTGKKLFERKIKLGKGTNYPSPTIAGNTLFVSNDNGRTAVLKLDAAGSEIGENSLPPFRSSPVFIGNRMYIRTLDGLYCIGKK
jgi:outer membrane protein assembly factor BamB